ncbi:MAG: S9 family peptidase, partial [Corynebacterium sp.]|nr:S9 family peptidase [Corynebacterium sp.]
MKFDVVKSPQGADGEETRIWSVDRYVKNPALSPDGSLLAVVMVEADRFPVALQIPLGPSGEPIMGQEREVTLPIEGAVRRVVYSSCGKWLACEASTEGGDRDQIWFVTTDPEDEGAYPVDMESHETIELVSWDDDNVAYNAFHRDGNVSGKLIHPTAKDSRTIDSRIGGALIHSRDEYSLFRVGSRGNRELLVIRPDGSWRPLLPVDNGSTTEQGFVVPGHGEPTFLVRSDHLAEHFRLLKVTHTEHGSSVDVLLESDDAELEEFAVSTDGSTLAVLWNVQGWCDLEIYRLTPDGVQLLCAPAMPSLIATEPSLTADGRFLALGVSGPEFPPSVVLFDVAEQHWVGEDFSPIA